MSKRTAFQTTYRAANVNLKNTKAAKARSLKATRKSELASSGGIISIGARWSCRLWERRLNTDQNRRFGISRSPTPLAEILQERMGESKGVYVFTSEGGEVTHYYRILAEGCEAIGIAYGREIPGGFVTHDARHTAVTRMLQAGRDLATIGSITGHADKTLILHSGHASTESRDKAMDVLEGFAGNGTLGLG